LSSPAGVKRISLSRPSNTKGPAAKGGEIWPRFDKESHQTPTDLKKKERVNFVDFVTKKEDRARFTPLEDPGIEQPERKKDREILEEALRKTAFLEREAYEKGFEQGEKDGLTLGQKKIARSVEQIERLLIEIGSLKQEILKQFEKEMLALVFSIAEKIIHRKIEQDDTIIHEAVLEAMHAVTEKSRIMIKINPEDFDSVERIKPMLFNTFKDLKSVVITPDPSVGRGGCLLETPCGDVDAGVEARLDKIHQSLNRAFLINGDEGRA
jgi:flagellar assembly protein FliH